MSKTRTVSHPQNQEILVTRPLIPDYKTICHEIKKIFDSRVLTNYGSMHTKLESELKSYLKVNNLQLYNNATIALLVAIKALGLKGEIITTPFTFSATVHAIEWCGLTPVFCDIDEKTLGIDANKIEKLITPKTSAIMPVHVYGIPCDVDKIQEIATRHNLKLIYDAAHAFGVEIDGTGIGNFGDVSIFSFHATKLFNTVEGGAATFRDPALKDSLYLLKNFGIRDEETVLIPGINGKMSEIHAMFGIENLKLVPEEIEKRKKISDFYHQKLVNIEGIRLLIPCQNIKNSYQYFPILIDEKKFRSSRNQIHAHLKSHNIFSRKYFYPLCSNYECYKNLPSAQKELLPVANLVSEQVLCLPFYGSLELSDIEKICNLIITS